MQIVYRVKVVEGTFIVEDHAPRTARGMQGWANACRDVYPDAKVKRSVTYVPEAYPLAEQVRPPARPRLV